MSFEDSKQNKERSWTEETTQQQKKTLVNMIVHSPQKRNEVVISDVEGERLQCRKSLDSPFQGRDHGIVKITVNPSYLTMKLVLNSKIMKRSTYSKHELI